LVTHGFVGLPGREGGFHVCTAWLMESGGTFVRITHAIGPILVFNAFTRSGT